jgi:hypothetical protein
MHTNLVQQIANLSDDDLLVSIKLCVGREREATATLVAQLAEVDARRLYLGEGCSSLFTYCTQILHLSEHAAYLRIEAARVARRFPVLLGMLAEGAVHLTAVGLLSSHLTAENHGELLDAARHKSKRQVEELAKRKLAATDRPREGRAPAAGSRHIPADVKRQVWVRDGGQCAFVGRYGIPRGAGLGIQRPRC